MPCIVCGKKKQSYNYKGVNPALYCVNCKKEGMINIYIVCEFEDCLKTSGYGFPGGKKTRCSEHHLEGMVDLKHPPCIEPGCLTNPSYGFPKDKKATYCFIHHKDGMKNIISPICEEPGCETLASFNFEGKKKPIRCELHYLKGMINVISKRCEEPGCKKIAKYGFDIKRLRCSKHKTIDMIDLDHFICNEEGCKSIAVYNFVKGEKPIRCRKHFLPGMIRVDGKNCHYKSCDITASFGFPGEKIEFCVIHKEEGMVYRSTRKCSKCKEKPYYGHYRAVHCLDHKTDDEIDVRIKKCGKCLKSRVLYKDGICKYCFPWGPAKFRGVKEEFIHTRLISFGFNPVFDRFIKSKSIKRRPDFLFISENDLFHVIIEVDEFQHKRYDENEELKRTEEMVEALGTSVFFIRYNPDDFSVKGVKQKITPDERSSFLIETLQRVIKSENFGENVIAELKLFYDEFDGIGKVIYF